MNAIDSAHDGTLIDAFCDRLWLQDGLAQASLASYRRDLAAFDAWLATRGKALLRADRGDLDAWLADQFAAKAKATSVALYDTTGFKELARDPLETADKIEGAIFSYDENFTERHLWRVVR